MMQIRQDVIGLLPAGGKGVRIAPLPCSKELFPIGFHKVDGNDGLRPKVVSQYLLEKMRGAGIRKVFFIIREGKWDIPAYYRDGVMLDMHLAYVVIPGSSGPPDTLDRAYPFMQNNLVAFGFPDILFTLDDVFGQLLQRQMSTHADVVLGLFPALDHRLMDMIRVDAGGRVTELVLKPAQTDLHYGWICAVWAPAFTQFLQDFVPSDEAREYQQDAGPQIDPQGDLPVGAVIQAAIRHGIRIDGVTFPEGTYLDIGTPEALVNAVSRPNFWSGNL